MKTFLWVGLLCCLAVFPVAAEAQTTGTTLSMRVQFDDGSPVDGTVTLGQVHVLGSDTILATRTLSRGYASVVEALSATTLYNITLTSTTGVQLLKFPMTTALINPQDLKNAQIHIVLRKADNSIRSARIEVSMGF